VIEENSKTNNIRDLYKKVNSLRKGYQPRLGKIINERGDLQADPTKIVDVWKSYFDKLLNVHNGERTDEFEIHTAEPWIPESNVIEIEMSVKGIENFQITRNRQYSS